MNVLSISYIYLLASFWDCCLCLLTKFFTLFVTKRTSSLYRNMLKKFAAFAVCHEPISRRRFVVMSLMPTLAGIIPLMIFLICPANEIISGICIPVGIMGMISPMPDYMDIHIICKQTPRGLLFKRKTMATIGIYKTQFSKIFIIYFKLLLICKIEIKSSRF